MKTANRSSNKRESSYGMTGRAFNAEIDPLIAVIDLRKRFKSLEVLKGIDLYIKQGSVTVLIGPSGSGKSTLLRCINQLETIQGGDIQFEGHSIARGPVDINKVRQRIGMVFQHFNLFPHLTVLENIRLYAGIYGLRRREMLRRAVTLLDRLQFRRECTCGKTPQAGGSVR